MNGMRAKKQRKQHAKRFDENGLPRDVNEWTVEDWMDLHNGMQAVIRKIAKRHGHERQESGNANS